MSSKNVQVQGTNDSSIVSKLSAANKGYYNDAFLKFFCNKSQQRSPLINRGYYIRHKAIEAVFESWFQTMHCLFKHSCQVISLGAGFDTSYFRLKQKKQLLYNCRYIEIDFPEVVQRKQECINAHNELKRFLTYKDVEDHKKIPEVFICSDDYVLLGFDLNNVDKLQSLFSAVQLEFNVPTLFLTECAITYMEIPRSGILISWAKNMFPDSAFVTYEQVYPDDGFGIVMQNHFNTLGSPLKSVKRYSDLKSQRLRFLNLGWSSCYVRGIYSFWFSLDAKERARISNLELFDEFETLHGKCFHYVVIWACQGAITAPSRFEEKLVQNPSMLIVDSYNWIRKDANATMQRFAHQMIALNKEILLISGGFGNHQGKHQRLDGLVYVNLKNDEVFEVVHDGDNTYLGSRMHHSMVMLKDYKILIYGGRSAPNNAHSVTVLLHLKGSFTSDYDKLVQGTKPEHLTYVCNSVEEKGILPEPRWRHSGNIVIVDGIEHLFIFGGCTNSSKATNDCHLLNTETWTWSSVLKNAEVPFPCHSHSAVVYEELIIISGGLSKDEKVLNSVHTYNVSTMTWRSLSITGMLSRYSHSTHMFKDKLFLIGGMCDSVGICPYVACIDLTEKSCIEICMPAQDPEFPILLHNHRSVCWDDGEVVIIGGGGNCFSFGTHFNKQVLRIQLRL